MRVMAAAEFKARCLRVMDEVLRKREPVLITKKGKPVAKVVPPDDTARDLFGCLADRMEIVGDVESPIEPPEAWEALR